MGKVSWRAGRRRILSGDEERFPGGGDVGCGPANEERLVLVREPRRGRIVSRGQAFTLPSGLTNKQDIPYANRLYSSYRLPGLNE
ncbi:hypothetical protein PUN28_016419 [Cardiocondyla obscurior]|uniref:Uncharacterized protein n=1 Tax=Cardiocondyla obscurior TaxID=286306 RepID=A0AAW2EPQ8_9HYME